MVQHPHYWCGDAVPDRAKEKMQISRNQQLQGLKAEQAIENKGKCSNAGTFSFAPTPILIGPTFEINANKNNMLEGRFAIAPMMGWVDL